MAIKIKGEKIDWLSAEMLRILVDNGGRATTRTFTRETGAENKRINYRYDILMDAGLITTQQPDYDHDQGQFPPKQITLTDEGERAVAYYDLETDNTARLNVDDRMTRLEYRLNRLEDELAHAYDRIGEIEDGGEDREDDKWGWDDNEI